MMTAAEETLIALMKVIMANHQPMLRFILSPHTFVYLNGLLDEIAMQREEEDYGD